MTQFYFIFHIQTTKDFVLDTSHIEDLEWPSIIYFSWELFNEKRALIKEERIYIQPNNPNNSENLLGNVQSNPLNTSTPFKDVFKKIEEILKHYNPILVSYNCEFSLNTIIANLSRNKIDFDMSTYKYVCIMKESISFCDLPNLTPPKLKELYYLLFHITPNSVERYMEEKKVISKSFFKLIDLDVINIENRKTGIPNDISEIDTAEINIAIEAYISDLNKYPLFYEFRTLSFLTSEEIKNEVKERFNKFYQTAKAKCIEIPYDRIINRILTSLHVTDIVIKYILVKHLKERVKIFSSIENYEDSAHTNINEECIKQGKGIVIKVDISNCYESIEHKRLIETICKELQLKKKSNYIKMLSNALTVNCEGIDGRLFKKKKGLIIGNKADEYLAEFFLEKINDKILDQGISVNRAADEFIFYTTTFSSARKTFKIIQTIIEDYGLSINNSKTIIKDYRPTEYVKKIELKVESNFKGLTLVEDPEYGTIDYDSYPTCEYYFTETNNVRNIDHVTILNKNKNFISNDIDIDSYKSALIFLRRMTLSKISIEKYETRYNSRNLIYEPECDNSYSMPDEISELHNLDLFAFSMDNLQKIKKIIYLYPKSEYYTALAIQILVFIATNTVHFTNIEDLENENLNTKEKESNDLCVESNLIIIEVLCSEDVHEYQKYILLRYLFKKNNELSIDKRHYEVKTINCNLINMNINSNVFENRVLDEVKKIKSETRYYPLIMICSEILK